MAYSCAHDSCKPIEKPQELTTYLHAPAAWHQPHILHPRLQIWAVCCDPASCASEERVVHGIIPHYGRQQPEVCISESVAHQEPRPCKSRLNFLQSPLKVSLCLEVSVLLGGETTAALPGVTGLDSTKQAGHAALLKSSMHDALCATLSLPHVEVIAPRKLEANTDLETVPKTQRGQELAKHWIV